MSSLTAHKSIAAVCKASVGKIALFFLWRLCVGHRKQAESLAALQSVLATPSPWSPEHHISHGAQTLLPEWEPICRHWATLPRWETIPPSWPATSQLGTATVGLACKQPWQRLSVQERGHQPRGHPGHVTSHVPGCASAAEGREGWPSLGPSPSQSSRSPELPWRALTLLGRPVSEAVFVW